MQVRHTGFTVGLLVAVPLKLYDWLLIFCLLTFPIVSLLSLSELALRSFQTMSVHRRSRFAAKDFYDEGAII